MQSVIERETSGLSRPSATIDKFRRRHLRLLTPVSHHRRFAPGPIPLTTPAFLAFVGPVVVVLMQTVILEA